MILSGVQQQHPWGLSSSPDAGAAAAAEDKWYSMLDLRGFNLGLVDGCGAAAGDDDNNMTWPT